jgi:multisubunit Na+/H+ antiporter MnhB subunit
MFTIGAILLLVGMVWASGRRERQEHAQKAHLPFIRQYLRLAVYLLMGIIVMLGVIADRLH